MQNAGAVMKALLMICLVLCAACADAGHRIHHRRMLPKIQPCRLSWKQIAAGGAAVGTVVAAYKVSNGVENGLEKAAEKEPGAFLNIWAFLPHILVLAGIFAVYKWYRNFQQRKDER